MDKYDYYRTWAPDSTAWSAWVKPVLFAHLPAGGSTFLTSVDTPPDCLWLGTRCHNAALVLDLPGAHSVRVGLQLAATAGFRPIPLFTSAPPDSVVYPALVPTDNTLHALQELTRELATLRLAPEAPPAFLLDANRLGPGLGSPPVETFDNRSAVFASDLPSARLLREHGITRCVVVRDPSKLITEDLGYALLPWRKAGIAFEFLTASGTPLDFSWPPSGFWSRMLYRAELLFRLKPGAQGGFGRFIPEASGG